MRFPAGPRGALHARRPEERRPAGRHFRRKRRGEERRGGSEAQAQMARGRDALLAATLLLLAATAQGWPRRAPPSHRRVGKQQYMLPAALEHLVRRNHNCSVERRELQTRMRTLKATCKVSSGIPEAMAHKNVKTVVSVFLICLLAGQVTGLSLAQLKNMMKMPRQMCMQRSGASKDMVDAIQQGQFADDPKLKCYTKCVQGMMQAMKKDVYSADAAMAQADKLLPDTHKERVKAAIQKCKDAAAGMTDPCEVAFAISKCNYEADPEVFLFP